MLLISASAGYRGELTMKTLLPALTLSALAFAAPAHAQDNSGIVGVWRFVSQTLTEVQSGKVTKFYGERPGGFSWYSKGGRAIFILVGENRQKPSSPVKDEEKIKLLTSMAAASGTYRIEGDKIIASYDTSWDERWTGTTQTRNFKIQGNTLTLTSAPAKNAEGVESFFTVVLERVE
jgi:hypothetical protein